MKYGIHSFYVLNMWDYRLKKDRERKQSKGQAIRFKTEENGQLTIF